MLSNLKTLITRHLSQHVTLYFIVILCFSIGITSGVFSVKALSSIQKDQLSEYMASFLKTTLTSEGINNHQVFLTSLYNNLKTTLLVWVLAVSIIAFPLVFVAVGLRGFILGFTVGFLIENLGYKGIIFTLVSIFPQSLITIPIFVIFAVVSINYSTNAIRNRKSSKYVKRERFRLFFGYTLLSLIFFGLFVLGSLIEGYVGPELLKGVSNYLLG